jgi:hypothetical protein
MEKRARDHSEVHKLMFEKFAVLHVEIEVKIRPIQSFQSRGEEENHV